MGLPVRFAAPDSQCQGRGRVNSGMPVRLTLLPEKPSDSPKVQAFGITPAGGVKLLGNALHAVLRACGGMTECYLTISGVTLVIGINARCDIVGALQRPAYN